MAQFIKLIARESFDGANDTDIDGRIPDGGGDAALAVGMWQRHPDANGGTGTLGILSNMGAAYSDFAHYPLLDIPGLPAAQRAEVSVRWPTRDVIEPGGDLFCAFQGTSTRPGNPNPSTVPRGSGHSSFTLFAKWVGGSGTAQVDATLSDATHVIVNVTVDAGGNATTTVTYVAVWGDTITDEVVGGPVTLANPSYCIDIGVDCNTTLVEKFGPNGFHTTSRPTSVTIVSATWSVGGGLEADNVEGETPPIEEPEFEEAWLDAAIRHDPVAFTCYKASANFEHFDVVPTLYYQLWYVEDGDFRLMRETDYVDWPHDATHTHSLEIDANNVLRVYIGSTELTELTFDLNTDVAEEDDDPVPILTTGHPSLNVSDFSGSGLYMEVLDFSVYVDMPCEGGPENPYPNDPPPHEPIPFGFHVMQIGQLREVLLDVVYAPDDVQSQTVGAHRRVTAMYVMKYGVLRPVGTASEEFPPPNTGEPPYWDPCMTLEELPPGTIVPMPLTERFLGISHLPISIGGPVLNGTRMGLWGGIGTAFSQAAARGVIITTSPGGRHPYLGPNGEWSLPHFINRSLELLQPVLSILQAEVAAGRYPGHSIIDDFESPKLWKPNGVPHDELQSALATIRAACPGIPFGVRGRPSQFSTNLGFDFYEAAYKSWGGHTPTSFVYLEYNRAKAWGATIQLHMNYLHGGNGSSGILHNDGTMLSGHFEMSANEVASYLVGMYDAADAIDGGAILQGTNGYEYTPTFLQRPGMIDAFTIGRNRLAALPPLP